MAENNRKRSNSGDKNEENEENEETEDQLGRSLSSCQLPDML